MVTPTLKNFMEGAHPRKETEFRVRKFWENQGNGEVKGLKK